ncbi:hypothetical protein M3P19_01665 [Muricauda sp. 2012CJ35-5]|uniref:Lipoprotein n=1 Tax=Flagellimonas spongiicola TaxID=2942208 RepID=A0ABT0PPS9_9FLAO|nr:hypothetical protein [Allomuricauda spongiicola]MCL6272692.1 hypothetical protein [Allomuricauda spongiicola]
MRTQIKIPIFIALIALFVLSCSQEDVSNPEEFKVAKQQVQFDFNTTEESLGEGQNEFNATIVSIDPLAIESEELEVFTYFDHETNTYVEGIAKIGTSSKLEADNGEPCETEIWYGYVFNPYDLCFYYGSFMQTIDCSVTFSSYKWKIHDMHPWHFCLKDVVVVL